MISSDTMKEESPNGYDNNDSEDRIGHHFHKCIYLSTHVEFNYTWVFVYSELGSWKGESACCIGIINIVITFVSKYILIIMNIIIINNNY